MLRSKIEEAGGLRAFARKHKLSPAFISDVARGNRKMSERMQIILGVQVVIPASMRPRHESRGRSAQGCTTSS